MRPVLLLLLLVVGCTSQAKKQSQAHADVEAFQRQLDSASDMTAGVAAYNGHCPDVDKITNKKSDPWGNDYDIDQTSIPWESSRYVPVRCVIFSRGPDGQRGTVDDIRPAGPTPK